MADMLAPTPAEIRDMLASMRDAKSVSFIPCDRVALFIERMDTRIVRLEAHVAGLVVALRELLDAGNDEALDDPDDDGHAAALDRLIAAECSAEGAIAASPARLEAGATDMSHAEPHFTLVFEGDIRKLSGNPLKIATPYGLPVTVAVGDALDMRDKLLAQLRVADFWLENLIEDLEINTSTTTADINAVSPDNVRNLAKVSLETSFRQIRDTIADAEGAQ